MNNEKIGKLIYTLRKEHQLTQLELAVRMKISDKTISKWERGLGCPDISLLAELARIFNVDLEGLLAGELDANEQTGGNMKKLKFYVCPVCQNLITAGTDTAISCCGKKLSALVPQKAGEGEKLNVIQTDGHYFISASHSMTREHYISFVALLTGDSMMLRRQYPEWDLQTRIPAFSHGMLMWYCTQHGLFYQVV